MALRPRDVVVVGASAGGVEALRAMVADLPADLPAAVLVVLHLPSGGTSALAGILDRAGPLSATPGRNGERLATGHVYVAPPDHHLLVIGDRIALSHGPTENGHRPAINALFRSAVVSHDAAVTGVLLSGVLDDGVAGLRAIAAQGGVVVIQAPDDALYPALPSHALAAVSPDHVVPAAAIGEVLGKIAGTSVENSVSAPELLRWENDIAGGGVPREKVEYVGAPSEFSCPDCDGALTDIERGQWYRCRMGHAWSAEALLAAQGSALDRAMWTALRTLEERTALTTRMATQAHDRGSPAIAARYEEQARETTEAAEEIRRQLG
ncbi:chemotaxis protein CheB [Amycolatopsis sp. YIM 10]|uniref:chemotaxis protein CheB n=1 Tax=Amycolatopsis sp. YIM 10 TaxID=2653857 RepID=UPI0012907013|nr:chemotaxis protein CheB [Amycolatopsis sp. YIM 10]QFU93442.1 Chemotaxis response regulator protein-glutamate methylesterase of group 3 operon [Amycolatopsis sp. YIM 10]